jgi:NADH dehydrogenase (ubiquinone) 1 alpha subcomplex subunit 11
MQSLFNAQYYAKPAGEDYVGKMYATNRIAVSAALGVATMDILMYSHPKGYLPTISRLGWWVGPAIGMASAFTTGHYLSTRIRGKDDK